MRLRRCVLPIVALALASCSNLTVSAASVDGQKISEAEVEAELDRVRSDPTFQDLLQQQADQVRGFTRRRILTGLIQQTILAQSASDLGIEISQEQVDRLIADQAQRQGMSVAEFLEAQNLTQADANTIAERVVRQFELRERVAGEVDLTEAAIEQAYEANIGAYQEMELRRITVPTQEDAQEVIAQLQAGSSFAAVAEEESIDDLADEGGEIGFVPLAELSASVATAVSEASVGEITEPVPSAAGFEVYEVLDRRTTPLEEVSGQIEAQLRQGAQQQAFEEWLSARIRDARIVVNPKYGRFDPSALEVVAVDG